MKKFLLFVFIALTGGTLKAQSTDVGVEFQVYPTGILPGVRIERNFGERQSVHLRLGANIFDHRDLGKNISEKGSGVGFTLGYRRYFRPEHRRFFMGLRNDIWWNSVDWTNVTPTDIPISGRTEIVVLQPTLEGGFSFVKNNWVFTPAAAFGFEINVVTKGRPTGQGPILLLGLTVGYRF